ncbi:hypothetical protein ACTXGQ_09645 [Marinobacter sp. 1Y8]
MSKTAPQGQALEDGEGAMDCQGDPHRYDATTSQQQRRAMMELSVNAVQ